jgi:enoyl-CoA hydratase/carnithine racemase
MCCDVKVMTARDGMRIGLNEVANGLKYPPRTFAMVRSRLAPAALEKVVLEAGLYDAKTALGLGLVDALGEEAEARSRLETLSRHPREAYAATKSMLRGDLGVSAEDQREFLEETVPYWASEERKERLRAVLKKK